MRFYVIEHANGETVGCELTRKAAHATAQGYGLTREDYSLDVVDCPVNADTIRRLLGHLGGYATDYTPDPS